MRLRPDWLSTPLSSGSVKAPSCGLCAWTGLGLLTAWWPRGKPTACKSAEGLKTKCEQGLAFDDVALGTFLLNSIRQMVKYHPVFRSAFVDPSLSGKTVQVTLLMSR